jgi:hypothetical protein
VVSILQIYYYSMRVRCPGPAVLCGTAIREIVLHTSMSKLRSLRKRMLRNHIGILMAMSTIVTLDLAAPITKQAMRVVTNMTNRTAPAIGTSSYPPSLSALRTNCWNLPYLRFRSRFATFQTAP